ncbi:MAG TPA: hypothetical protein ENH41_00670, partial [Candidatus Omnitrophica bacterium]|nr:hypothetical protein [Candidatus Omnitrophota bacterium]
FVILDKKVIKQKTTHLSPKPQAPASLISTTSKNYKSSTKNTVSKSKEVIKKDASIVSIIPLDSNDKTRPVSFPELTLNGIAASGESGWAIINGRVVKPGDKIKGAEVVGITEEKVYLDFKDESFTLTFE